MVDHRTLSEHSWLELGKMKHRNKKMRHCILCLLLELVPAEGFEPPAY